MKKLFLTFTCLLSLSGSYAATSEVPNAKSANIMVVADPVDLNHYVGKYKFEGLPFEFITIAVKEGKLTVNTGSEEGILTPLKDADSFDAAGQATLKFIRNAEKKVTGVTLQAQGFDFEGKKEL
ncbi:DUF3471 domain-containing protein [Adhaeribacter rhizoryzae]|uniref:DUF3471 domain-containing protein n=1 Tax=Adhaeribacter rhizoryzae TaxID=2607907 RepID=A0A5M6DEN8_9BACT|nr:DUF3471 domain-containing protein [Adhaeribacter rhizoryzae]KAA5544876.1 DUF3471 domain-containing protein [Adhaeribacter rhizoryzae]